MESWAEAKGNGAVKLHVGCGSVYLREWVNVDIPEPNVFLARERGDLVERYITTEGDYYGRHRDKTQDSHRKGPLVQEYVCDAYGRFTFIPARSGSAEEILSRQVFEHLDRREARDGLRECHRVLQLDGILRLDVPDPDETLRKYGETRDEVYCRYLFGPRRDEYGSHFHYTRQMLTDIVTAAGFRFIHEEPNIHFYPAFCLRFARA